MIFSDNIYGVGKSPFSIKDEQLPKLMIIYSLGYISIYLIFFLLYRHALKKKQLLQLTPVEIFDTHTKINSQLILISIGIVSVLTAFLLPGSMAGQSWLVYILIGPAFWIYYAIRGKKRGTI